jgi:hypothetical protein
MAQTRPELLEGRVDEILAELDLLRGKSQGAAQ